MGRSVMKVKELFTQCANVYYVDKPVFAIVNGHMEQVTKVRDEQGMFILETAPIQNGVAPNVIH